MVSKGTKVAVGIGAAIAVVSGAAYAATRPAAAATPTSITTIDLVASATEINVGDTVTFTATATDSQGGPVSNVVLSLVDKSTSQIITMGATNSSGVATVTVTFSAIGSYVLYAED